MEKRKGNEESSSKRDEDADEDSDSSSDDDFGPRVAGEDPEKRKKKRRKLDFETRYLEALPNTSMYETSYMHRDVITHVLVSQTTDFVITGSVDGHVKFWKKMPQVRTRSVFPFNVVSRTAISFSHTHTQTNSGHRIR